VPKPVERVLLRAMAKNPDERYQSMEEFADAIEALDPELQPQVGEGAPSDSVEDTSTPAYGRRQTVVPFRSDRNKSVPTPPPFDVDGGRPRRITEHLIDVTQSKPPSNEETQPAAASPYPAPFPVRSGDTDVAQVDMATGEVRKRGKPTPPEDVVKRSTVRAGFQPKQRKTDLTSAAPESKRETLDADELDPDELDRVRTGDTLVSGEQTFLSFIENANRREAKGSRAGQSGSEYRAAPRRSIRDTQVAEPGEQSFIPPDLRAGGRRGTERVGNSIEYSASAVAAAAAEAPDRFQSQPSPIVHVDDDWEADYRSAVGTKRTWWVVGPLIVVVVGVIAYAVLAQVHSAESTDAPVEPDPAQEVISSVAVEDPAAQSAVVGSPAAPTPAAAADAPEPEPARASHKPAKPAARRGRRNVLGGTEVAAGFKRSRDRILDECGRHEGKRVKIQATVSGSGFVISAKPAAGNESALATCVARVVEKSATFDSFKKKSDTFLWTYRL
jgi:hypothetical protein